LGFNIFKRSIKISIILILCNILILGTIPPGSALDISYNLFYDKNGNLGSGFGLNYTYNDFNQLSKVATSYGTLIAEYFYDYEGKRIKKIEYEGSLNTTILYIDKNFIQVLNNSGVYNETYYYDEYDLIAKKDYNGNIFYYHPDHLGSTILITDSSGNVVADLSYEPYGELIGSSNERFTFTSKELDEQSNLYYYGARYYEANLLKRFTQPDTIIQDVYNPQSLNRYSYVLNNPYKYVDPSGNYFETVIDVAFILYDINEIRQEQSLTNYLALGGDIVGAVLPFATELGLGVKGVVKSADKIRDATKTSKINKGINASKITDKISDTNKVSSKAISSIKPSKLPKEAQETLKIIDKGRWVPWVHIHFIMNLSADKDYYLNDQILNIIRPIIFKGMVVRIHKELLPVEVVKLIIPQIITRQYIK